VDAFQAGWRVLGRVPLGSGDAGRLLGPYEIRGPLGAGGMGEAYRARDTGLEREIAIKVLPAERVAGENRRRRFVQEAKAASALNHPHIVQGHRIDDDGTESQPPGQRCPADALEV
jgi:serine/threonine protein kinase